MRPKCECVYFAKLQLKVALSQVGVAADPHLPTLPNQALAEHLGLGSSRLEPTCREIAWPSDKNTLLYLLSAFGKENIIQQPLNYCNDSSLMFADFFCYL